MSPGGESLLVATGLCVEHVLPGLVLLRQGLYCSRKKPLVTQVGALGLGSWVAAAGLDPGGSWSHPPQDSAGPFLAVAPTGGLG